MLVKPGLRERHDVLVRNVRQDVCEAWVTMVCLQSKAALLVLPGLFEQCVARNVMCVTHVSNVLAVRPALCRRQLLLVTHKQDRCASKHGARVGALGLCDSVQNLAE